MTTQVGKVRAVSVVEAFWQLARPRTCFVGVLAYVFGLEITGGEWGWRSGIGVLVMLAVPAIANLHNSYTDVLEDQGNLPGRAVLVKAAGIPRLRAAVIGGLAAVVVAGACMGVDQLVITVVGGLLLLSYSAPPVRAKAHPGLGLVVFSLVVVVPFLAGTMMSESWAEWRSPLTLQVLVWTAYLLLFFVAKGFVKNVPDFHGDAAAGLRTSATVMRSARAAANAAVGVTWAVYALFPVTVFVTGGPPWMYVVVPWSLVACWHVYRLRGAADPGQANLVLKRDMVITVITLATIAVAARGSLPAWAIVLGSLIFLLVADLVGRDSRAPEHLSSAPVPSPEAEHHA